MMFKLCLLGLLASASAGNNICGGKSTRSAWKAYGSSGMYVDVDTTK